MAEQTTLPFVFTEDSTHLILGAFVDEGNSAIAFAQLTSITLTLYAVGVPEPGHILNARNGQSVLPPLPGSSLNNVTITALGEFTWAVQPEDNVILDDTLYYEHHVALFRWTWQQGTEIRRRYTEIPIQVRNLSQVPA
jgi:hypothetical protein